MSSQKLETILNLSLESTPEQRARSGVLDVGFDEQEKTWELIVKYSGSLDEIRTAGGGVEELLAGYAILTVPESLINALVLLPQIEYVEIPKNLQENLYAAKQDSCILPLTEGNVTGRLGTGQMNGSFGSLGSVAGQMGGAVGVSGRLEGPLSGAGVLMAVLDSGIDYYLADFRNADGTTRIAALWDQTLDVQMLNQRQNDDAVSKFVYAPPEGFAIGAEFSEEQINAALETGSRGGAFALIPSTDRSGHGTEVAAVSAGNNSDPLLRGVATGAQLLIVKLANRQTGFPRTTELMRGVQWALDKAQKMGMPMVINLSFGNSYGPHDGSSLISRYLDNAAETGRTVICVGSGNEAAAQGHAAGRLEMQGPEGSQQRVELVIADFERTVNVQLWKNYVDQFEVRVIAPTGEEIEVEFKELGKQQVRVGRTQILIYVGEPSPYSVHQEIFFDFLPLEDYVDAGVWTFFLTPRRIVSGVYQFYLPGQEARAPGTRFTRAAPELTLTVPSTSAKVITVGASNSVYDAYADFSGRGALLWPAAETVFADTKPDLVAPGVNLRVPTAGGGTVQVSGTSFSTPLVAGTAALLMEWGIVRGNDPYLYGEKMKAVLRAGARPLRGEDIRPNERTGYGQLCAVESIEG